MEENNLRTDLLLIINEYVLLDVDGKVTSTKEWINEMLDKIVSRVELPVKPEIAELIKKHIDGYSNMQKEFDKKGEYQNVRKLDERINALIELKKEIEQQ